MRTSMAFSASGRFSVTTPMQGWSGCPLGDWTDHFSVLKASIDASSFFHPGRTRSGRSHQIPGSPESSRNSRPQPLPPTEILVRRTGREFNHLAKEIPIAAERGFQPVDTEARRQSKLCARRLFCSDAAARATHRRNHCSARCAMLAARSGCRRYRHAHGEWRAGGRRRRPWVDYARERFIYMICTARLLAWRSLNMHRALHSHRWQRGQ